MHKRIPRLIVMVGLSASGKSSYAKELEKENPTNTIVISSDAIREEICGSVEDQSKNGEVDLETRNLKFCEISTSATSQEVK